MNKLSKNEVLSKLNKELSSLSKGKNIKIKFTIPSIKCVIPANIAWDEECHSSIAPRDTDYEEQFIELYWQAYTHEEKKHCAKYNRLISKFIEKCNKYANSFNENEDLFWNQVVGTKNKQITKNVQN